MIPCKLTYLFQQARILHERRDAIAAGDYQDIIRIEIRRGPMRHNLQSISAENGLFLGNYVNVQEAVEREDTFLSHCSALAEYLVDSHEIQLLNVWKDKDRNVPDAPQVSQVFHRALSLVPKIAYTNGGKYILPSSDGARDMYGCGQVAAVGFFFLCGGMASPAWWPELTQSIAWLLPPTYAFDAID